MAEAVVTTEELDPPETIEQGQPEPQVPAGDADDIALAEAEAALAAEEQAEGKAAPEGETVVQPDPAAAAAPAAPPAKQPVMVPIERLNDEATKRRRAEDENLILRGAVSALDASRQIPKPVEAAPAPELTPAQQIAALREQQRALAKSYNDGEIDAVEWETKRIEADDKVAEIRASSVTRAATEEATDPARSDRVLQADRALESDPENFPILATTKPDGSYYFTTNELLALSPIAEEEMRAEGRPFNRRDADSIIELKTRVAELAQHNFGHRLPAKAAPAVLPAKPAAKPGPTAQQRAAKIGLAEKAPPDINRAGAAATVNDISESRIAGMAPHEMDELTDAEVDALERKQFA